MAVALVLYWLAFQFLTYTFMSLNPRKAALEPDAWLAGLSAYYLEANQLLICLPGALIGYLIYEALRRTSGWGLERKIGLSLVLTAVGAAAFVVVAVAATPGMSPNLVPLREFARQSIAWFGPLGLWTTVALAITYNAEVLEREQRLSALRTQAHEAQVRALHFQLNPHFLYNTLNAISALVLDGRTAAAEATLLALSDFLRATLSRDPLRDIELGAELELQRLYLDIEKVRFEDALSVTIAIPAELGAARVPALILQPIVENAVKFGADAEGRLNLSIVAARDGDRLLIRVADTGAGGASTASGAGIGLNNVRERLALRFGPRAGLEARPAASGFVVELRMPLEFG